MGDVQISNAEKTVRFDHANVSRVASMDPSQTPDQAALIKQLERSARAEMRLRTMALEHARDELRSQRQQRGKNATRD